MHYLAYFFLISGVLFIVLAGVGLVRMPNLLMRMQATSKASTLGVILMLIGLTIEVATNETKIKGGMICIFLLLTAPIAAHAIAIAAEKDGSNK